MPERTEDPRRYVSPLKALAPEKTEDFNRIETYTGKVSDLIDTINMGISLIEAQELNEEGSVSLFYRTYELMKMTLNEKVDVDRSKSGHTEEAIKAVRLAVRLAIACDLQDPIARVIFGDYKELVEGTNLKTMLDKDVHELPDRAIMPDNPAEADMAIADEIVKKTDGEDFAMLGLFHRGAKREIDIYLNAISLSGSTKSRFWPVRYSPNYADRLPNVSFQEIDMIRRWVEEGRQLVVIGPTERIDSKVMDLFKAAIPNPKPGEARKTILPVPLPVAKPTPKENGNGNNGGKLLFLKRAAILKGSRI